MAFAQPESGAARQKKMHVRDFNITLICSVALLFFSAFSYGFSDQSFASTQATSAFKKQFGDYNHKKKTYALPALYLSLLNSLKAGTQLVGMPNFFYPSIYVILKGLIGNHRRHCWKLDQQALWPTMVYLRNEHLCSGEHFGYCVWFQPRANAYRKEYPVYACVESELLS